MEKPPERKLDPRKEGVGFYRGSEEMVDSIEDAERELELLSHRLERIGVPLRTTTRMLEVGSGEGVFTKYLIEQGYDVVAIDARPRGHTDIPVAALRIEELPFDETDARQRFDIVVAHAVFDPAIYEQDLRAMFSEITRVLEPGGVLYINSLHTTRQELEHAIPKSLEIREYSYYALLVKSKAEK